MTRRVISLIPMLAFALIPTYVSAQEGRQIEEIIVTAEKRQSTVSDTSIAITAFDESMIEDLGIQNANEMINYIPATTRDTYDIRIRGVGRNFRALGGDPGVATYYNGVYSEDFGIAVSENALYDVARIEVLRGPQGTLYGRNSIGGALNYISNSPTKDWTGEGRVQVGRYNTREYYGIVSGPIIDDQLSFRLTGMTSDRDGWHKGQFGSHDTGTTNDQNFALAFKYEPTDTIQLNLRWNDRRAYLQSARGVIIDQGFAGDRGRRPTELFALGLEAVDATALGAVAYTHPVTGAVAYGRPSMPGVDTAPIMPNPAYNTNVYLTGTNDFDKIEAMSLVNGPDNSQPVEFDHNAVNFDFEWDINENMSLKYIYGYSDFDYTFDLDTDHTASLISNATVTVLEDVYTESHELQLLWQVGDKLTGTSGAYKFYSNRLQDYTVTNDLAQGRVTRAANYGFLDLPQAFLGGLSILQAARLGGPHVTSAPMGTLVTGRWDGDPTGDIYNHVNTNETDAYAVFTQVVYTLNEDWALTAGVRYAKDEKSAVESRGGYTEANFLGAFAGLYPFLLPPFLLAGQTNLSMTNILMGNAAPSGNPASPIVPLCPFTAEMCPNPLRLAGVPISWHSIAQGDADWSKVTGRINLDWTPTDDILMYFSVTTGYRAGGYSLGVGDTRIQGATGLEPLTHDAEEVIAYEIGYKGTHLDRRLQLYAALYAYRYDNYQDSVDVYDPSQDTTRSIIGNAPEAENMGFEIEGLWLASEALTLSANYSYTHTEYTKDTFLSEDDNPFIPAPLFGDTIHNLNGNPLKRIPKHKGTVWGSYEWLTDIGRFRTNLSWSYTGDYTITAFERSLDTVPSRVRTDAALTWTDLTGKIRVRAFVDNVFDDINLRGIGTATHSSNYALTGSILYPRYWGVDLRWAFGG